MADPLGRDQPPFGRLAWDAELQWWASAPAPLGLFGGQPVRWFIPSEPRGDATAPLAPDVVAAAQALVRLKPSARRAIHRHVWMNYREIWGSVGPPDIPRLRRWGLWRHVRPNTASIVRRTKDGRVYISIDCDCVWEPEHGLELVLQDGVRWVRVSAYSGHATDGDAFVRPALDAWMADPGATLPLRTLDEILRVEKWI